LVGTGGLGPHFSATFDVNNHVNDGSVSYDAAGNVMKDAFNSYTYNSANELISAKSLSTGVLTCYLYDAQERRVQKTTGATACGYPPTGGTSLFYVYDLAGNVIDEVSAPSGGTGNWTRQEIYAGPRHLATFTAGTSGQAFWDFSDWLGTERARVNAVTGAVAETCTSLPWGDSLQCTGSDQSPMHFTGKQRDVESSLDNFDARYLGSSLGRFMSVDPENAGALDKDPQTWNAYSYVRGNPLRYSDPDGTTVWVCVDNGWHGQNCFTLTDEQYKQLYDQQNGKQGFNLPGGLMPNGNITCNGGQVCGSVRYREPGNSDDPIIAPAFLAAIVGGIAAGIRGIFEGILSGGAKAAAEQTASRVALNQILASGSKGAVRQAIEESTINDAQKVAVKQVLTHARGGQDIVVEKLSNGTIRVTRVAVGNVGGRAEYVTDIAVDGSRSTVQYGYSAAGDLVHIDPK
jgi:RHS repeat-associated protein